MEELKKNRDKFDKFDHNVELYPNSVEQLFFLRKQYLLNPQTQFVVNERKGFIRCTLFSGKAGDVMKILTSFNGYKWLKERAVVSWRERINFMVE